MHYIRGHLSPFFHLILSQMKRSLLLVALITEPLSLPASKKEVYTSSFKSIYHFTLAQTTIRMIRQFALTFVLITYMVSSLFGQIVVDSISRPGLAPDGLAVYETGNKLCVFDDRTNHLLIYNALTLALEKEIVFNDPISDPNSFGGMVIDEAEGKLYIAIGIGWGYPYNMKVAIVDLIDNSLLDEIPIWGLLPQSISGFAYDQVIRKIFIFMWDHWVFVLDLNTDLVTEITLNGTYCGMALNPITHEVLIGNREMPKLSIINGITYQISEIDAVEANALTVNWLENKAYILTIPFTLWILNIDDGSYITNTNIWDSESLIFNPGSNKVYTSAEIGCVSTIVDGISDNFFNLPMEGGAPIMGFRHATKHAYFVSNHFIAVLDETTQMLEKINFDHPHAAMRNGIQHMAVNQTSGRVFVTSVSFYYSPDYNPIYVLQDTEMMTSPNVLIGSRHIIGVLDPFSYNIVDFWELDPHGAGTAQGIAYRRSGGRVYVTSFYDTYPTDLFTLSVHAGSGAIDTQGVSAGNFNACLDTINMAGHKPITPVTSLDGNKVFVTCSATNLVCTVDASNDSNLFIVNEIGVGTTPWGAALTPDGSLLYITNKGSNNVSVISTVLNTVIETIPVGTSPWGVAINPSGTKVYVANSGLGTVSVINTSLNNIITTILVGTNPHWLKFTPDGKRLYVSNWGDGTVSVIDTGTDTVIQTLTVGANPEGIEAQPDGSKMYVVNSNLSGASSLSIINPSDFTIITMTWDSYFTQSVPLAIADPTSKFAGWINACGSPINGALVRALQSGVEKGTATTNASGDYCIFNLKSGTYDIEVSAPGYVSQTFSDQTVEVGLTTVINFSITLTDIETMETIPSGFSLSQNYPNPLNSIATIEFSLPQSSDVSLKIFNFQGQEVSTVVSEHMVTGIYTVEWNASGFKSGIYFYRLQAGSYTETKKLILLK